MDQNKKKLAVFDVDDTLVEGQTQRLFLNYLYENKFITNLYYLRIMLWFILYKLGIKRNPEKIMNRAFLFLRGIHEEKLESITNSFYQNVLSKKIYSTAILEIEKHKDAGNDILLLSNAVHPVISKIAQELNIQYYVSTELELENKIFTGRIKGEPVYGKNKVKKLRSFLNSKEYAAIYGYGDHYSDLNFLSFVNHAYVINPTRKMTKVAKKHNWKILTFT